MKAFSVTVDIVVRSENSVQAEVEVRDLLAQLQGRGDIYAAFVAYVEATPHLDLEAARDRR